MTLAEQESLFLVSSVAAACAVPGVFLVLRRLALIGDAISHVLLFGIVIGTYSSIYVASPIILLWGMKKDDEAATPIAPQPARP